MKIVLLIFILYSLVNLAEAWLEVVVIALKDPKLKEYKKLNKIEHARSFVFAGLVCFSFILFCIYLKFHFIIWAVVVNRRLVFDFPLKKMRNRPLWTYEGDGPVDGLMKWLFGTNGAWKEFLALIVITIAAIWFQLCSKI